MFFATEERKEKPEAAVGTFWSNNIQKTLE